MIGRTIQNYRIEELLGEGGMGTVYRATDTLLRRPVAVKMLHPHLLRDSTFMERFRNEAVLSAQLNHPNVSTLYNLLQDRTDNFMVMELVDGMTLERLLTKEGKLPLETAVRIIIQALDGLQHAHYKGILHRDIKPANLMLTREGSVKLMDFGIARMVGSQRFTRADRVVGTLEYMAPELLNGAEPSIQSDLYAVGVLLYELLSGKMPFETTTESTLVNQILNKKPIPLRSRIPDLPKPVEEVLDKLFQKKPEKRFEKAWELRQALASIVPAGPVNPQLLEPKSAPVPPTRMAEVKSDKPPVGPTRLATSPNEPVKQPSRIRENLMSLEGMILMGAVVVAIAIIGFWMIGTMDTDAKVSDNQKAIDTTQRITIPPVSLKNDTVASESDRLADLTPSQNYVHESDSRQPDPVENKPQKPVNKKPPVNREEGIEKPKEVNPPQKEVIPPKEEKETKPVEKEEPPHKTEPPKPVRNVTVELRSESFSVEFAQTVSSEASEGQTVWLRTVSPIVVDGTTVVQTGAKVRAKITGARSAGNSQKALLAIRFEAVEAVNGQWVAIKFPEYSDKSSDEVVFTQGRRVNNVRTARTTLTVPL
ncbi:MAG: protein kinase [Spirosomataceae bacterium]